MRVLVLAHPDGGTAGVFADEAAARGITLDTWTPGAREAAPPGDVTAYDAVVVLGGGQNVMEADRHPYLYDELAVLRGVLERGQPVLGVCLGHQLLAAAAGATVRRGPRLEMGFHPVELTPDGAADPLVSCLPATFTAYGWHSWEVDPAGRPPLARSAVSPQAVRYGPAAWGVQFHPEVTPAILRDWYADIASDPDVVATGLDAGAALEELLAGPRLEEWMALGRRLFGRFADLAYAG